MQLKPWTPPTTAPIRCAECGAPLTGEEVEFYSIHCERCTSAFHEAMQRDIDAE